MDDYIDTTGEAIAPTNGTPAKKKPGPKPRQRAPLDEFDAKKLKQRDITPLRECAVCGKPVTEPDLDMVKEIVLGSADRIASAPEELRDRLASLDLQYLSARLTGLCGAVCRRKLDATE